MAFEVIVPGPATPEPEVTTVNVEVVCQTETCENFEVPIPLTVLDAPTLFFCGPCGNVVTSINTVE